MNTTNKYFSPSINIIRDFDKELVYIPTSNAQQAFNQIANEIVLGIRSFNIIGTYGVGKSSFLWAFEKTLNKTADFFELNPYLTQFKGYEVVNIVGEYSSVLETFAKRFKVKKDCTASNIFQSIERFRKTFAKKEKGLLIVIDELGKFLEFAAKNNTEQELYFFQQLAEYVNSHEKNVVLLTTVHQDFNSYAFSLTKNQRNEWNKVKGRLKEITFNEPVEQLLFLASERMNGLYVNAKEKKDFIKLFNAIKSSRTFPMKDYLNPDIARKLFPFDILAASVLTLALQKYGQNERSLFSFIDSHDYLGLRDFQGEGYYNIGTVYDYLYNNYSILTTKYNPHYTQWAALKIAIERIEGTFGENTAGALACVKTIGLLNIFAPASAKVDNDFLNIYGKLSLGVNNVDDILNKLVGLKIIRFVRHSQKYILFEGTDLDIELAVDQAGDLIEKTSSIVDFLNTYFDFPCVLAKANYYKFGTPRFFEFRLTETPILELPVGEVDGFINLIFSESLKLDELIKISKKSESAIVFGWYRNFNEVRNLVFEIQKIQKVIENNLDDKIAIRELNNILGHQTRLLNQSVLEMIKSSNESVQWYFQGEKLTFDTRKEFNRILSKVCDHIYFGTPVFKNELVNKTKLSSAILTARKNLIRALGDHLHDDSMGFSKNTFPPEKTIYLSLLKNTGLIQKNKNGQIGFSPPSEPTFELLWETCEFFLEKSKSGKRNLVEFIDSLSIAPFKLKKGFIDFLLPIFLFAKRDDFALFEKNVYVPYVTDQVLEIVVKNPNKYFIKSFDIDGLNLALFTNYRLLLNQKEVVPTSDNFIQTIRPFLSFYKGLPDFTKSTKRLPKEVLRLREEIKNAKDPETTFFEGFPLAMGYTRLQLSKDLKLVDDYIELLQSSIRALRVTFSDLQDRFELFIINLLGLAEAPFEKYKSTLENRFKNLKFHFLQQHEKVFIQRINSNLERKDWLSAVCHASIGKTLENLSDSDEPLLFEKFAEIVHGLDNLYEISSLKEENELDDFLSLEIQTLNRGSNKRVVRIPHNKNEEIKSQKTKIESILGKESVINIAALTEMLKDLLDEQS